MESYTVIAAATAAAATAAAAAAASPYLPGIVRINQERLFFHVLKQRGDGYFNRGRQFEAQIRFEVGKM